MSKNDNVEVKNLALLKVIEEEPEFCIALAKNERALEKILNKIQTSLVSEENRDVVGHTIFAIKQVSGIFDSAVICGKAIIAKKVKEQKQ